VILKEIKKEMLYASPLVLQVISFWEKSVATSSNIEYQPYKNDMDKEEQIKDFARIIREIERDYRSSKIGDGFEKELACVMKRLRNENVKAFNDFCIDEIKNNENGCRGVCLELIKRIKEKDICPDLERIFLSGRCDKETNHSIILTLLSLGYKADTDIYGEYIRRYSESNGDPLFLIVPFCLIDPANGIPMFVDDMLGKLKTEYGTITDSSISGIYINIGFIVGYLNGEHDELLVELINRVAHKDVEMGICLKELFEEFLTSGYAARTYKKEYLQEITHKIMVL
jgi:hypothetical protein